MTTCALFGHRPTAIADRPTCRVAPAQSCPGNQRMVGMLQRRPSLTVASRTLAEPCRAPLRRFAASTAAALAALPVAALAQQQQMPPALPPPLRTVEPTVVWLDFRFGVPSNNLLVLLLVTILAVALVVWLAYRLTVGDQIRRGVHPNALKYTLLLGGICVVLVSTYLLLPSIGTGYFIVLGALFLFEVVGLAVSQRIIVMWILFLLILAALIVLLDVFKVW